MRYYGPEEAGLPAKDASILYQQLQDTNFPTLYAATIPFDDFGESFVSYVHMVLLNRLWEIRISSNGYKPLEYSLCWDQKRCQEKREITEQILKSP